MQGDKVERRLLQVPSKVMKQTLQKKRTMISYMLPKVTTSIFETSGLFGRSQLLKTHLSLALLRK
ncbi:unnamed protein product [Brassica oleracea]